MTKLSCVIPAFNEAESLPQLWERLRPVLTKFSDWEVVIVSDGSTDETVRLVSELHQREPRVRLVPLRRNQGKAAALVAGWRAATGDRVVTLDADLQDQPEEIPGLLQALESENVDMVTGWKQHRQDPWYKVVSSRLFNAVANRALQTHFHDLNSGLKVYRREVVESLDIYGDLYRFIPLLVVANGWRVIEKPVAHQPRQYGTTKYGLRLNGMFDLISLLMITKYRWRPLHFFGSWGLALILIGTGILMYLSVLHFQGQVIGDRPLLIFGVLFFLTGGQLFFAGLLGDLIVRNYRR